MNSLKSILIVSLLAVLSATLTVTGWLIFKSQQQQLLDLYDASLETTSLALSTKIVRNTDYIAKSLKESKLNTGQWGFDELTVEVVDKEGNSIFKNRSVTGIDLANLNMLSEKKKLFSLTDEKGERYRAFAMQINTSRGIGDHKGSRSRRPRMSRHPFNGTLIVMANSENVWKSSEMLGKSIVLYGSVAMVVVLLMTLVVVNSSLRSLRPLAEKISNTSAESLEMIEVPGLPKELSPIVERLNELLLRLDESMQREKTLSADLAHDLRTPVAALISSVQVCLSKPRREEDYRESLKDILELSEGMQTVISTLLILMKLESGQVENYPVSLPLYEMIQDEWQKIKVNNEIATGLNLCFDENLVVTADKKLLRLILSNALSNAANHATEDIAIRINNENSKIFLEIENNGCSMLPEDVDKIFDRFWRSDQARARSDLHCGLGTTMIRRAVYAMRGEVSVDIVNNKFCLKILWPYEKKCH